MASRVLVRDGPPNILEKKGHVLKTGKIKQVGAL